MKPILRIFHALFGHSVYTVHMDAGRLFWRCHECGYEAKGWDVQPARRWARLQRFRRRLRLADS